MIPIIANIIYYSVEISNCNKDISRASYETYIGDCTYNGEAVILEDLDLNIYVGKYNSIVPEGTNYGKCIYSKHAKVIVYWEAM